MILNGEAYGRAGIALLIGVVSSLGSHVHATRDNPANPISEKCYSTTQAGQWYDTVLHMNTATGELSWSGKRDFTLACYPSLEIVPCRWCHAYSIEVYNGWWSGYEVLDDGMTDLSLPCNQKQINTRLVTASNLQECRWYRIFDVPARPFLSGSEIAKEDPPTPSEIVPDQQIPTNPDCACVLLTNILKSSAIAEGPCDGLSPFDHVEIHEFLVPCPPPAT